MKLTFDYQKGTQAINFFSRKTENKKENKMKVIKLIWLADRYHIRKYGRPIIGDEYIAMPLGPVGSGIKDIAEATEFSPEAELDYSKKFIKPVGKYEVQSLSTVDMDVFSETDIEALNFAYEHFGDESSFDLSKLAHRYPEWKKFEISLRSKQTTREKMDYNDFFKDPEDIEDDKFIIDKDLLEQSKDSFQEMIAIHSSL